MENKEWEGIQANTWIECEKCGFINPAVASVIVKSEQPVTMSIDNMELEATYHRKWWEEYKVRIKQAYWVLKGELRFRR